MPTEYNTCEFIYNIFFFGTVLDFDTINTGTNAMQSQKQNFQHTLELATVYLLCTQQYTRFISIL